MKLKEKEFFEFNHEYNEKINEEWLENGKIYKEK